MGLIVQHFDAILRLTNSKVDQFIGNLFHDYAWNSTTSNSFECVIEFDFGCIVKTPGLNLSTHVIGLGVPYKPRKWLRGKN